MLITKCVKEVEVDCELRRHEKKMFLRELIICHYPEHSFKGFMLLKENHTGGSLKNRSIFPKRMDIFHENIINLSKNRKSH